MVAKTGLTWVHLSDLHFGHTKEERHRVAQEVVCQQIINDVKKLRALLGPPDFIFITGDIAFRASEEEYNQAGEWLDRLLQVLYPDEANRQVRVLMVPGNHDIIRSAAVENISCKTLHDVFRSDPKRVDDYFSDQSVKDALWPKFEKYQKFSASYGSSKINPDSPYWSDPIETDLGNVFFVGLNSNLLSFDNRDSNANLALGESQLRIVSEIPEDHLLILLQHHPFDWLTDGSKFKNILSDLPHIQFCGHVHEEGALCSGDLSGNEMMVNVAGAGGIINSTPATHGYSWGRLTVNGYEHYPRSWYEAKRQFRCDKNRYEKADENGMILRPSNKLPIKLKDWLRSSKREEEEEETPINKKDDKVSTLSKKTKGNSVGSLLSNKDVKKMATWVKDAVCYSQGAYFQFSFLASMYHKQFREAVTSDPYDFDNVGHEFDTLGNYLVTDTQKHYKKYYELLKTYFSETSGERMSDIPPRICVKTNDAEGILTFSRFGGLEGYDKSTNENERDGGKERKKYRVESLEGNTGLQHIKNKGKYYICKDVPGEASRGKYKNPRLFEKTVVESWINDGMNDDAWPGCWENTEGFHGQELPSERSCYKSTLIIPMTLQNNDLELAFKEKFQSSLNIEASVLESGVDRHIYGFLCFDHVDIGYFNDKLDVDIGYIFADIMSLYFLTTQSLTEVSGTYQRFRNIIFDDALET